VNTTLFLRNVHLSLVEQQSDDLFVVNGRLGFYRPSGHVTPTGDGWFVLPGLVDAHAHLMTSPRLGVRGYTEAHDTDPAELVQRVLQHLAAQRAGGVLAVRDTGAPTGTVVEVMGTLDPLLPHLQAAGRFIAPPGRYLPHVAHEVSGPGLLEAVTQECARVGGWVKFIGDYPHRDRPDSESDIGWTIDEVRPAVQAAREAGARVAMHATTAAAAEMAIALDVDSVEHGCHLRPEHLRRMAERGRAWTPTLAAFRRFLARIRTGELRFPEASFANAVESTERLLPSAVASGVTLLCGSDAALDHGDIGLEVFALIDAGIPPDRAIRAATTDAWAFLRLGVPLAENAIADFVAYECDPLADPEVLLRPRLVVRNGRVVVQRP
jgi:imidazolonepropionase-like amidohydrolase